MKQLIYILLFLLTLGTVHADLTTDNQVYYSYDTDDTSGTTMNDLSVNGNDGTCAMDSNCDTVTGLLNQASDFDGVNDRISSSYQMNPQGDDFTIAMWINLDTMAFSALVSNWKTSTNQRVFEMYIDASDILSLQTSPTGSTNTIAQSNISLTGSTWQHVAVVKSGTTATFYIDGQEQGSGTVDATLTNFAQDVVIGARSNNFGIPFDGQIDETAIYNRTLSLSEIQELYNSGIGFNPYSTLDDNFNFVYSGNQSTYPTKNDGTLNGYSFNDGTLNGFANDTRIQSKNSSFGGTLDFDGVDDYVQINNLNTNFRSLTFNFYFDGITPASTIGLMGSSGARQNVQLKTDNTLTAEFTSADNTVSRRFGASLNGLNTGWNTVTIVQGSTSSDVSIYFNGVAQSLVTNFAIGLATHQTDYRLGRVSSNYFSGELDNIKFHNISLNSSQVIEEMNSPNPVYNTIAYYSFDETQGSTLYDTNHIAQGIAQSPIVNVSNGVFNISRIDKAMAFDGVDDYVDTGESSFFDNDFSISFYFNKNDNTWEYPVGNLGSSDGFAFQFPTFNRGGFLFKTGGSTLGEVKVSTTPVLNNVWYQTTLTYDAVTRNASYYIDGLIVDSLILSGAYINPSNNLFIGNRGTSTEYFNGSIDDLRIYNISLNSSQVSKIYNDTYLDSTNLVAQYTFDEMQNSLIHDRNSQTCVNCENVTLQYTLTQSGLYSDWNLKESSLQTIVKYFYIDNTNPNLNVSLPSEVNSYEINLSSYINVSDPLSGIAFCTVEVVGQGNTTCTNESFTFNTNGNQTLNVYVEDNNGNQNQSLNNLLLVNPTIKFYFKNNITSDLISNYNFGSFSTSTNSLDINIYDLGLNTHTLLFVKNGFYQTNKTFTFNQTTDGNFTFFIQPVTLYVEVFDSETLNNLTFDVIIENSSDVVSFTGLNVLNKTFEEIPSGDISLRFSANNFSDGLYYTTLTPFTALNFDVYLTPINLSSVITFTLTDFDTRQNLGGVLVEARTVIENSSVTVQQVLTGDTGLGYLLLDELSDYTFYFSKDGYTQAVIESIPQVTNYNVRLKKEAQQFSFLNGVNTAFYPQSEVLYLNTSYNFLTQIQGTSITLMQYEVLDQNQSVLFALNSTNPTGTDFNYTFFLLNTTNITSMTQKVTYFVNGVEFVQQKEYRVYNGVGDEIKLLQDFGNQQDEEYKLIRFFVILVSIIVSILVGNKFQEGRDFVSPLTLLPIIMFTWLGWIPLLYGTIISLAIIGLYIGGNKK